MEDVATSKVVPSEIWIDEECLAAISMMPRTSRQLYVVPEIPRMHEGSRDDVHAGRRASILVCRTGVSSKFSHVV